MPVKKSKSYTLTGSITGAAVTLADSKTYYFSGYGYNASETDGFWATYIPKNGIIRTVQLQINPSTILGTAEDIAVSLRVNTTDTALGNIKTNAQNNSLVANVNVPVTTADFFQIKIVTPVMATNPTGCLWFFNIIVDCT